MQFTFFTKRLLKSRESKCHGILAPLFTNPATGQLTTLVCLPERRFSLLFVSKISPWSMAGIEKGSKHSP